MVVIGVRNGGGALVCLLLVLRLSICHALALFFLHVVEPRYWRFYLCVVIPAIVCNLCLVF